MIMWNKPYMLHIRTTCLDSLPKLIQVGWKFYKIMNFHFSFPQPLWSSVRVNNIQTVVISSDYHQAKTEGPSVRVNNIQTVVISSDYHQAKTEGPSVRVNNIQTVVISSDYHQAKTEGPSVRVNNIQTVVISSDYHQAKTEGPSVRVNNIQTVVISSDYHQAKTEGNRFVLLKTKPILKVRFSSLMYHLFSLNTNFPHKDGIRIVRLNCLITTPSFTVLSRKLCSKNKANMFTCLWCCDPQPHLINGNCIERQRSILHMITAHTNKSGLKFCK